MSSLPPNWALEKKTLIVILFSNKTNTYYTDVQLQSSTIHINEQITKVCFFERADHGGFGLEIDDTDLWGAGKAAPTASRAARLVLKCWSQGGFFPGKPPVDDSGICDHPPSFLVDQNPRTGEAVNHRKPIKTMKWLGGILNTSKNVISWVDDAREATSMT